jgi:hypothetical protein
MPNLPALKANSLPQEATITVNGHLLSHGQAMTVRVALAAFVMDLTNDGLGDDEHGKLMVKAYQERAHEIFRMMGLMR